MYRLKQDTRKWARFESDLGNIFPDASIEVSYSEDIDEYIDVFVTEKGNDIPLDLCGTGLLQGIHIFSYYHLFEPHLILLDEPDSHLHPNNQRLLCSLLSTLSQDHEVRVVMTTHSRHVIDALSDEASLFWVESGNARLVSKDEQLDLLLDLGALDIVERLNAPNIRVIVLTEDKTTKSLGTVLKNSNFLLDETLLLSYKGVTNTHLLQPLIKQISTHSEARIIVHRDRDYLQPDEAELWKTGIRALNAVPFVTRDMDIEDYFVSEQALINLRVPVPGFDFNLSTSEMVDSFREQAIQDYVNGRVEVERKNQNAGQMNPGRIAVRANQLYADDPRALIKGKKKRGWYREYFQRQFDVRLDDVLDPLFLADEELRRIGLGIFGNLGQRE